MKTNDKYEVRTLFGTERFTTKSAAIEHARWVYDNTGTKYIAVYFQNARITDFSK